MIETKSNLFEFCSTFSKNNKTSFSLIGSIQSLFTNNSIIISEKFCEVLDQFERNAVIFSQTSDVMKLQKERFHQYLEKGETISDLLKKNSSVKSRIAFNKLTQRIVALKYRIEAINGGVDTSSNSNQENYHLFKKLETFAQDWKTQQKMMVEKKLTEKDLLKLQQACRYPEFAKLLLNDFILRKDFFIWIIRDQCPIEPFIQFPFTSARIKSAHLGVRVGRFGGGILQVEKRQGKKIVTLPFATKNLQVEKINILDELREVELNGGLRLTVKKVMDIFERKNKEIGDLEFFESTGITNWNSHQLGYKDPTTAKYHLVDLNKPYWWQDLPIFQRLETSEVAKRYGDNLERGDWVAFAKGSRQTQDLDFDGRHGYLEVAIPSEKGDYLLFSFGKFASTYPQTAFELLSFLLNTVPSKLAYPDENLFYTHREHASYPIKLNAKEGEKLMDFIKIDLIKSREGNLFFQFACENCGFWVQSVVGKVKKIPNLFKLYLLKSYPSNIIIGGLFKIYRLLPKKCQSMLISITDYLLGSFRGLYVMENGKKTFKSVLTHPLRKEQSIYQVGYLHEQIKKSAIRGFIENAY